MSATFVERSSYFPHLFKMRPHHQDNQPISTPSSSFSKRIILIVCAIVFLFIGRNLFTKDYNGETRSFLTSIGRSDAIETVIPKTMAEVQLDRKKQLNVFDQLVANMTIVMAEYQNLRADVDRLKGSPTVPINTVPPIGNSTS